MALSYPREQEVWGFDINFKNVGILLNVTDLQDPLTGICSTKPPWIMIKINHEVLIFILWLEMLEVIEIFTENKF